MAASTTKFTDKLHGSTVLILGGTSGVGFGTASALLAFGSNVIISSSNSSRLASSLSSLKSTYPSANITGFTCDLASHETVESNLQTLLQDVETYLTDTLQTTNLDHLIYTAGDNLATIPLDSITSTNFHSALQVRAISALLAVKTFHPLLRNANTSSITLTSGSICEKPIPGGWSILAFTASGLNGMTRQLAADLAPVRVNCVAPGVVDTDLWRTMKPEEKKGFMEKLEKELPTGRISDAEDIAESYLYLLRGRNVTGSTVHINGGAFL